MENLRFNDLMITDKNYLDRNRERLGKKMKLFFVDFSVNDKTVSQIKPTNPDSKWPNQNIR